MTAHELARKLLEGPDALVVQDVGTGYAESEPREVGGTDLVTLWQVNWGSYWGDLDYTKPKNPTLTVRSVEAVKIL